MGTMLPLNRLGGGYMRTMLLKVIILLEGVSGPLGRAAQGDQRGSVLCNLMGEVLIS